MIGVRVASGTTTSISVRFLVALLDQAGNPPDALLRDAGLSREQLGSPELQFPLEAFDRLWADAAALQPAIGLRLIDRFPPGQMHVVTHLALRSATVGEALAAVVRFMAVNDSDDQMMLEVDADVATLCYANPKLINGARRNPWIVEHFLSMTWVFLCGACARELPLDQVQFMAPMQSAMSDYRERFGRDPGFGEDRNALIFGRDALDWPLLTHDHYLLSILERFASEHLPAAAQSISDQARDVLRRGWLSGEPPTLAQTASACGVGKDALRSRLADAGLSFRQLKDDARRDLAKVHLAGRLSIGEIAYLLGFSEPAALQHAVKRWFGVSAGEFRKRHAVT